MTTPTNVPPHKTPVLIVRAGQDGLTLALNLARRDAAEAPVAAFSAAGVPLQVVDIASEHTREVYGRALVLVRPTCAAPGAAMSRPLMQPPACAR